MNKKAVSLMVGYVLLVVIAVGISILVYNFLKLYVPKEKPECEKELSLIIEEVKINCDESNIPQSIDVTVNNRGLFKVDAVFIRLEKEGRRVKEFINDPNPNNFNRVDSTDFWIFLNPGDSHISTDLGISKLSPISGEKYELEVQPAYKTGKGLELALCTPITQPITISCPTA